MRNSECVKNISMVCPPDLPDYTGSPHPHAEGCAFSVYVSYKLHWMYLKSVTNLSTISVELVYISMPVLSSIFEYAYAKTSTTFQNSVGTSYMARRRSMRFQ
jgi:hypothetical protein